MTLDVITLGETMAMFIATDSGPLAGVEHWVKRTAGAESNVATGLARLGHRVGWVSRVGADSFGTYVREAVAAEGVDVARVATDPARPTGFMIKSRSDDGQDPQVEYWRRGSAASGLSVADWDAGYCERARHLHVTGITPALSASAAELVQHAMARMRSLGRTISFDPNLRPRLWPSPEAMRETINRLAVRADWVLPGIAEGKILTGRDTPEAIADFYLDGGAGAVILKLGADGAFVKTRDGRALTVPGVTVARVVDTVGAGDGFAAGTISARLDGLDWPQALARGNFVGAQVIQQIGDIDGLPRRDQLPA